MNKINPNALLIGFGRRFATYKRAHLLFTDLDRLSKIVNNPNYPVQFIFTGKAHPHGVNGIVFSSSCTVYGEPDQLPVTEQASIKPATSPYGNTKQINEEIVKDTVTSGSPINAILLRYFNPIGAHPTALLGELPNGVPQNLVPYITQTAIGIREQLSVFGHVSSFILCGQGMEAIL